MIVNFSLENVLSIRKQQTFSFEIPKTEELPEKYYTTMDDGTKLLKMACVFGANASGKSNLIQGLYLFLDFVTTSFSSLKVDEKIPVPSYYFKDPESDGLSESSFSIVFYLCGKRFYYYVSTNDTSVIKEELYYVPTLQKKFLYKRIGSYVKWGSEIKGAKKQIQDSTRANTTILNVAAQLGNESLTPVYSYLANLASLFIPNTNPYNQLHDLEKEKWMIPCIRKLIKEAGIREITDVKVKSKKMLEEFSKTFNSAYIEDLKASGNDFEAYSAIITHNVNNHDYFLNLNSESSGTMNFITTCVPLLKSIKNNSLILIDEFEQSFHMELLEYMISVYMNSSTDGQMLFTTQSLSLLESSLLENCQIWFAFKDDLAESSYKRITDYTGVRKDYNRLNLYKSDKFGLYPHANKDYVINIDEFIK